MQVEHYKERKTKVNDMGRGDKLGETWINYRIRRAALTYRPEKTIPLENVQPKANPEGDAQGFKLTEEPLTSVQESTRSAWKELIISRKDATILWSIGFNEFMGNEERINTANFLLKKVNRELFNHDHDKLSKEIGNAPRRTYDGYWAEVNRNHFRRSRDLLLKKLGRDLPNHPDQNPTPGTTANSPSGGSVQGPLSAMKGICIMEPHMLSLDNYGSLHFHMLIDRSPETENVKTFRSIVYKQIEGIVAKNGKSVFDKNVVDVRPIWDIEEAADYLTKTARMHTWKKCDNICFIEPSGLAGVGVSYQRNARNC